MDCNLRVLHTNNILRYSLMSYEKMDQCTLHLSSEVKMHSFLKCIKKEVYHNVVNFKHIWDQKQSGSTFILLLLKQTFDKSRHQKKNCNACWPMIIRYSAQEFIATKIMKDFSVFYSKAIT